MCIQRAHWLLLFALYLPIYVVLAFHEVKLHAEDLVFSNGWTENGRGCGGPALWRTYIVGSSFSVNFTGNAVALGITRARDRGMLTISIDGIDFGTRPMAFDYPDPAQWGCEDTAVISGLELKNHVFKATLAPGGPSDVFEIFQFKYTAPDPSDTASSTPAPTPTSNSSSTSSSSISSSSPPPSQQPSRSPTPTTRSSTPSSPTLISPTGSIYSSTSVVSSPVETAEVTPDDPRIEYSPPEAWQERDELLCGDRRVKTRVATQIGSKLSFPFKGSAISPRMLDTSTASYTVSIDGQPGTECKLFKSSNSTCVNFDAQCNRLSLSDSNHIVTVTLTGASAAGVRRAEPELIFAGFLYSGSEVTATSAGASPSSSTPNAAAIGGGVGGALAGILLVCLAIFGYRRWRVWRARRRLAPSTIYMESNTRPIRPGASNSSQMWPDESQKAGSPDSSAYENLITGPRPTARTPSFRWRTKGMSSLSAWRTGGKISRPSTASNPPTPRVPDLIPGSIY